MTKQIGILLCKDNRNSKRFFILDKKLGKFCALSDRSDISCGSLMTYNLSKRNSWMTLHHIDVLELPVIQNLDDLIFFHHVLELSYYFIPLAKMANDIFDLLFFLYTPPEKFNCNGSKKLFLCKLFAHLGFYPEDNQIPIFIFRLIRFEYIDALINKSIDLSLERKLDQWLDYCIAIHPCANCFRTLSFFMRRS